MGLVDDPVGTLDNWAADLIEEALDGMYSFYGFETGRNYNPSKIKNARIMMGVTRAEFAEWLGGFREYEIRQWGHGEVRPGFHARSTLREKMEELREKE